MTQRKCLRRIITINNTKIKYIKILDKLYQVNKISFFNFSVDAKETDLTLSDVPETEVFDVSEMKEFKIRLENKFEGRVIEFKKFIDKKCQ